MGLLGNGFDDPQSAANMALAAGLLQGNFGGGLLGANTAYQEAKQGQLKNKLTQAQLENYASEIETRKAALAKQQQLQTLLGNMFGGGGASPPSPAMPGQLGSGSFGAVSPPAGQPDIPTPPPQQQTGTSRIGTMSPDSLALLKANGLDLVDVAKLARPDIQVSNGYAYDKNNTKPGFMPQLNMSQDGKTSMVRVNPATGLPLVSAPEGAVDTFNAYNRKAASVKPIKVYNPVTGREEYSNEDAVTQPQAAPATGGAPNGATQQDAPPPTLTPNKSEAGLRAQFLAKMGADPATVQREIDQVTADLGKVFDPGTRKALQDHLIDLKSIKAQMGVPAGGIAAGPSASEAAAAEAAKVRATKTAEADVTRDSGRVDDTKQFNQLQAGVSRAIDLLKKGPTHSGFGSLMDSTAGFFGKSTEGADVASQLDTLSGWLTSNVPRMQGPQSDKDVLNYRIMAAQVGDRTKPISQRLAAAQELQSLQNKYASLNGVTNTGGASGGWESTGKQSTFSSGGWSATIKK